VILDQNEQAVVFRFGRLQEKVLGPGGFHAALPRPFDELVRLPVAQKRATEIVSQFLTLKEGQDSARNADRAGPLDPKLDGSLMTGDKGLIHGRWVVTYEITDLLSFVRNVQGAEAEQVAPQIIRNAVENAAVETVAGMDAVDATRTRIDDLRLSVMAKAQSLLTDLHTGIRIVSVDAETIPPVQTRAAFENVTRASNDKRKKRDEALADATRRLNNTAGAAHVELEHELTAWLDARQQKNTEAAASAMKRIEDIILTQATGKAGEAVRGAESFKKKSLEDILADVQEFRAYLKEYERDPNLLFERLWISAQREIMTNKTLVKQFLPQGRKQIRLQLSPDPEAKRAQEIEGLLGKDRPKGDFLDWRAEQAPAKVEMIK
jgi:regulator of protease activity HflC (stomatin/prohibitin superfamily)